MAGNLGDLDELAVGRAARDLHAFLEQLRLVETVELVAMAMTLVDQPRAVRALRERSRCQLTWILAETHRPAEFIDAEQITQLVNHFGRRVGITFGRIGVLESRDVARVFDR